MNEEKSQGVKSPALKEEKPQIKSLGDALKYFHEAPLEKSTFYPEPLNSVFVLDVSWMAYRSYHVFKDFKVKLFDEEYKTGIMYGMVRTIASIFHYDRSALVFLAIDSKPTKNLERMEDYKAGRPTDGPHVHEYIEFCLPFISMIPNVFILKEEGAEADDFMSGVPEFYNKQYPNNKFNFFIYSSDQDAYQCIRDNVFVFNTFVKGKPEKINIHGCEKKWGVPPESMPMLKAIRGKDSDNLPPIVPRFPKEMAMKLATLFKTPDELYENITLIKSKTAESRVKYVEALEQNKNEIITRYAVSKHDQVSLRPQFHQINWKYLSDFVYTFRLSSMKSLFDFLMPAKNNEVKEKLKEAVEKQKSKE